MGTVLHCSTAEELQCQFTEARTMLRKLAAANRIIALWEYEQLPLSPTMAQLAREALCYSNDMIDKDDLRQER